MSQDASLLLVNIVLCMFTQKWLVTDDDEDDDDDDDDNL